MAGVVLQYYRRRVIKKPSAVAVKRSKSHWPNTALYDDIS